MSLRPAWFTEQVPYRATLRIPDLKKKKQREREGRGRGRGRGRGGRGRGGGGGRKERKELDISSLLFAPELSFSIFFYKRHFKIVLKYIPFIWYSRPNKPEPL